MICAVCREQFKDYYEHIFSARHKRGVQSWSSIFSEIDKTIKDVQKESQEKRKRHLNQILKRSMNPESLVTTGEDTSSGNGVGNQSKSTTASSLPSGGEVITIDLDGEESAAEVRKREQKAKDKYFGKGTMKMYKNIIRM